MFTVDVKQQYNTKFCISATSLTVSMVFGLEGRVVSVLAFFTMVLGMVKMCGLLFWGGCYF